MLIKFKVKIELPIIRLSSFFKRLKQVLDAVRGERRLAKYPHDLEHWPANFGVVLDNGNEAVGNDGDMNLYAPCILRFSPKSFDLEMLLDPFEQLHFPPILVEQGNFLRTEIEVVCVVNETPLKFWGIVGNPSDESRVLLLVLLLGEADTLVFRLGASELFPFEYGHAEVDGSGIDGIESAMQFELLRDASGLGNGHHVKSKLLKDAMVSEGVGLRQHLSVDGLVPKSEVLRLLGMGSCYICEFPEASTTHELTEHQNQHMVPVRHRPTFGSVVVLGDNAPELPLREELYYLCKNENPYMHICSDLESDARVGISKPGQVIGGLKHCA